jgi:hypothetical protein
MSFTNNCKIKNSTIRNITGGITINKCEIENSEISSIGEIIDSTIHLGVGGRSITLGNGGVMDSCVIHGSAIKIFSDVTVRDCKFLRENNKHSTTTGKSDDFSNKLINS